MTSSGYLYRQNRDAIQLIYVFRSFEKNILKFISTSVDSIQPLLALPTSSL